MMVQDRVSVYGDSSADAITVYPFFEITSQENLYSPSTNGTLLDPQISGFLGFGPSTGDTMPYGLVWTYQNRGLLGKAIYTINGFDGLATWGGAPKNYVQGKYRKHLPQWSYVEEGVWAVQVDEVGVG